MNSFKQLLGKKGENKAISYLHNHGFSVIKKHHVSPFGEIDIIAKKRNILYFIEVKTRSNVNKGKPYESVTKTKIEHLEKTAKYFLLKNKYRDYKLSIGVISIVIDKDIDKIDFYESIY